MWNKDCEKCSCHCKKETQEIKDTPKLEQFTPDNVGALILRRLFTNAENNK